MKIDAEAKAYADSVAAVIKRRRMEAELSMNRLGEASGLSQPMIGLIERGVHAPTIFTLFRIARTLGTTPAVLLAEVESESSVKLAKTRRKSVTSAPNRTKKVEKKAASR